MPNGKQQRAMRRFAGSCRFVYNKALAMQKENHEAGNKFIGYVPMAANLPNSVGCAIATAARCWARCATPP